eukprot:gene3296-3572_t
MCLRNKVLPAKQILEWAGFCQHKAAAAAACSFCHAPRYLLNPSLDASGDLGLLILACWTNVALLGVLLALGTWMTTMLRSPFQLGQAKPEDITDDMITAVAEVLRGSSLLVVSDSGFQVRRATAVPTAKEAARAVDGRSLYARPFPMMATLDTIVAFFQEQGVALNAVRLRRHARSKEFKGSVFVEAVSAEESERVLDCAATMRLVKDEEEADYYKDTKRGAATEVVEVGAGAGLVAGLEVAEEAAEGVAEGVAGTAVVKEAEAAVATGSGLAFMATALLSCRSVTTKAIAHTYHEPTPSVYLASSLPGLALSTGLQAALALVFGVMPFQLNSPAAVAGVFTLPAGLLARLFGALLVCSFFHCAYNIVSFKVLQRCTPVVFGVCNTVKRVFIILMWAALLETSLSWGQMLGVVLANVGACFFVLLRSRHHSNTGSGSGSDNICSQKSFDPEQQVALVEVKYAASPQGGDSKAFSNPGQDHSCNGRYKDNKDSVSKCHNSNPQMKYSLQDRPARALRLLYVNICAVSIALIFLTYALSQIYGPSQALQHTSKPELRLGQQAAQAEFAVRDANRVQCLQETNEALMRITAPFFSKLKATDGVALWDVAMHNNLGDNFLWAGSATLSTRFHRPPKYICAMTQRGSWQIDNNKEFLKCDDGAMLKAIGPNGLVLLHLGGNFGDLERGVQVRRLQYLKRWAVGYGTVHNWTVVQLPQSIDYASKECLAEDAAVLASLPAGMFHLMVSTQNSLQLARDNFKTTPSYGSPDTAFALGPQLSPKPSVDVFVLLWWDSETSDMANITNEWLQKKFQAHNLTAIQEDWVYNYAVAQESTPVAMSEVAMSRVVAGAEQIAKGHVVITNSLHATIMANFVGRPLIWIDTKQKKVN